ncbi:TPA: hypothetical protein ACGOYW_000507 [Streptococcus suis]
MTKQELEKAFKHLSMIDLGTHYLFDNLELYNTVTEETKRYRSLDEVLADPEIKAKLDKITFNYFSGGRGAGSEKMGGGFRSASDGGGNGPDKTYSAHPAEFNEGGRSHNMETVLGKFVRKYGDAKREYAVSVDEQGFAHSYRIGNADSVSIAATGKNHTIIHNHPSGGNFSKKDLLSTASSKNLKGIIATNSSSYYHFEKTKNFDSQSFSKAVNKAKWPATMSYSQGADWWLKKNQKKYGYKYGHKTVDYAKAGTSYSKVGKGYMRDDNIPLF